VSPIPLTLLRKEVLNHVGDSLDLCLGHFRVIGRLRHSRRGLFRNGEIAGFIAEIGVALLQVQRHRVMQGAADLIGFEMLLEFLAAGVAHDIEMVGAFGEVGFAWQLERVPASSSW